MRKLSLVALIMFLCMATNVPAAGADPSPAQAVQKKDPRELVTRLKDASVEDLKKLSFLELNLLKNAVFASRGYKFAADRPWLNEVFCGGSKKKAVRKKAVKATAPSAPAAESAPPPPNPGNPWDLNAYAFPACQESGPLSEDQKRAIANTRVATIKKLESFGSIAEVDNEVNREVAPNGPYKGPVWILGKEISFNSILEFGYVSTRRDLHGMNRMLRVIKNPEDFDHMEMLGLFMGDIIFLKNVLEAKNGKSFPGVQGWEISQLIGVVEQNPAYNVKALPPEVQQRIRKLEEIATKIQRSDLNDIPASLRSRPIEFSNPYDFEGC